ncbi:hypothetical protein KP509_13G038600 [Ceratopteris richardii]|uniref:Integrator complex subunit 4 n=1 Tax=Ceratopteris richardii TaxID=49495 RepID=A0A8T2TI15_CERRI|nr:hypothetical protein KP509_13G038600 [Ceratopteris richardii]
MKRGRDEGFNSECLHAHKRCEGESSETGAAAEICVSEEKTNALDKDSDRHDVSLSIEAGSTANSTEDDENTSLLCHQNPQVRLRALACLLAHFDLLIRDTASAQYLHATLCRQLQREENLHVAQQIVRLITFIVISTCKPADSIRSEDSSVLNSHAIFCSTHFGSLNQSTIKSVFSQNIARLESISEPAMQCIKMFLSQSSTETESPTFKLQVLNSLSSIAMEVGGIQISLLYKHLKELLVNSNPFIKAQTLKFFGLCLVTDSCSKAKLGEKETIVFFLELSTDPAAVVRKASLLSVIYLCNNGYSLTEECFKVAVTLFDDSNDDVRSLALQLVSLWVKEDPEENTDTAFLEVCKMMTDMELSIRIEACKAFSIMMNVREDLLLQALSKKPLDFSNEAKERVTSSLITNGETDVDISEYEGGLGILDRLNMGAFVHGIEDEFWEVRSLTLDALSCFCCVSMRARAAITEIMLNLLNDDSNQVRLKAVHKLIYVAQHYTLEIDETNLQQVLATLEDIDDAIRDAGKNLIAILTHSSKDVLKSTIGTLMKYMQTHQQEKDVWHIFHKLGRAHNTFVQFLANDLVKELNTLLSREAGLDDSMCGCILFLLLGASEVNPNILSLVPAKMLSLSRLLVHNEDQMNGVLKTCTTESESRMTGKVSNACVVSDIVLEHKIGDFLGNTVKASWNVKRMLCSAMLDLSIHVLRTCQRDIRKLLNVLVNEDRVALATYSLHCIECVELIWKGHFYFQHNPTLTLASQPSLSELAQRLDFVVKCMQHTYTGHTHEQQLDLLELSMIPSLWKLSPIASQNELNKLSSAVDVIKNNLVQGSPPTSFLNKVQEIMLETTADSPSFQTALCELCSTFWPRPFSIFAVQEMKAVLTILENDFEHPAKFLPNMPFSVKARIFTRHLENSRVWVCLRLDSLWEKFIFLDSEELRRRNPMITSLQLPLLTLHSKCVVVATVYVECPGRYHVTGRGPRGLLIPLTPEKFIHLIPASDPSV